MKKSSMSKIAALLVGTLLVGLNPIVAKADSFSVVSIANDITDAEKTKAYEYFGLAKGAAQEIVVTNKNERESLLGMVPEAQIGNKTVSSAYVVPTNTGGILVESNNLTWVTNSMLTNTLITLGITNAKVKAYAPYPVSGTGALTGIMMAFEQSGAENTEISEEQKEAANEELVMTGQLGDEIGKDEASVIVNEVKTQIIKDSPKTDVQIGNIITNVTNNYNITLSDTSKAKMVSVMSKINDLDLEYNDLKDTLKTNKNNLIETLKQTGSEIKEAAWYGKFWTSVKSFGRWIKDGFMKVVNFITSLGSDEEKIQEKDGIKYDEDGNIIIDGNLYIPEENRSPEEIKQEELESIDNKEETETEEEGEAGVTVEPQEEETDNTVNTPNEEETDTTVGTPDVNTKFVPAQ